METKGIRVSEEAYKKIYEIKALLIEMGISKNPKVYEIIDEAVEFYLTFLRKLEGYAYKKR